MGIKLGMDAKLYRNSGTSEAPTWTEITNCRDLTLSLEAGDADATTRGNGGWRAHAATLKDGTVEFEMLWDTADANFTAIQTAFFMSSTIEVAVMDGDITVPGTQGLRASMAVTHFSRNEALEEAITASVTLAPGYSATAPSWMTVEET